MTPELQIIHDCDDCEYVIETIVALDDDSQSIRDAYAKAEVARKSWASMPGMEMTVIRVKEICRKKSS